MFARCGTASKSTPAPNVRGPKRPATGGTSWFLRRDWHAVCAVAPRFPSMKTASLSAICLFLGILSPLWSRAASPAMDPSLVPEPLKSWSAWARWNETAGLEPLPGTYQDPRKTVALWPSRLEIAADQSGGKFAFTVEAYAQTWAVLPGSRDMWPVRVSVDGKEAAVLERDGAPAVWVPTGSHQLKGEFVWQKPPRTLQIPSQTGLLALVLNGQAVENATWDAQGLLWLEGRQPEPAGARDYVELKLYRMLEDGAPMWLRTELELTVSGKSRELELGSLLPEGWLLASMEGPLPMAVDASGRLKVQARAGKWTLHADAFSPQPVPSLRFAVGAKSATAEEFIALKPAPSFRIIELSGVPAVDVSQTTVPQKWRELPVYRWDTKTPAQIEERMRGMGTQQTPGLTVARRLWLDEDGRGLTFRDQITGVQQKLWRLDSAPGQQLGSVRNGGEGQLITRNPATGETGVEVRSRTLQLEATGRIENVRSLPASGWNMDAASASATLQLPPGWRLFALFGADYVKGDWLTAWTLLDLFIVLVFSMGVARVFGRSGGALAFVALVLSYREPEAPRYTWLCLLVALALMRVIREGWGFRLVRVLKAVAVLSLLLSLLPFLATQMQEALHPQLERLSQEGSRGTWMGETVAAAEAQDRSEPSSRSSLSLSAKVDASASAERRKMAPQSKPSVNLAYDAGARIQTGPPVPNWSWRSASYGWNGPVAASQQVHLVLLPSGLVRILTALRIALLLALCALLLDVRRLQRRWWTGVGPAVSLFCFLLPGAGAAEPAPAAPPTPVTTGAFPDPQMLQLLRERLAPDSDAFPHAADIPMASLEVKDGRLTLQAEIHVAVRTAVPLPGKLPAWSPLRVLVDELPQAALRREDGFLWVVLPAGVHRVRLEGVLAAGPEWEWAFQLKPRRVEILAPDWQVSGVRANGVPEQQVFFRAKQSSAAAPGGYDRQDFRAALLVERRLEFGLTWQVRTTVHRLSQDGRAVSVRIPLLAGEQVLTTGVLTAEGAVEVRLGAREKTTTWESELRVSELVELPSRPTDSWVEQWSLAASPVWNIGLEGLPPVYTPQATDLVPQWNPWPGEGVRLKVGRAEAVQGATVTVGSVRSETALGLRQRTQQLTFTVRSSLGEDFTLQLPPGAEVGVLKVTGKELPVRMEAGRLQVPVHPGEQTVEVEWRSNEPLRPRVGVAPVILPVPCANVQTVLKVPDGRWVLWTHGPLRGPAVRFWSILLFSMLAGTVLGRLHASPLGVRDWVLLCIGLTQVPLPAAIVVAGWLLCLTFRAREPYAGVRPWMYNLLQTGLVVWTLGALAILASAVAKGLLGNPEMFITGNGSSRLVLNWYEARSAGALSQPGCVHVSLWWYRLAMLLWALWLSGAVLHWLKKGWEAFSAGGPVRSHKGAQKPPPLPTHGSA
jgi:hypothetical protein